MTQSAAEMVGQAMAQIERVSPKDAFDEISSDHLVFPGRPRAHETGMRF